MCDVCDVCDVCDACDVCGPLNRLSDRRPPSQDHGFFLADMPFLAQLFHVRSFRRALGRIHSSSSLLVTSLQTLYAFYKYSEQSVLPPDEVRVALSALHAQKDGRFALGQQDDANECFEAILMQIHRDACGGSADDDDERVCSPACAARTTASGSRVGDEAEAPLPSGAPRTTASGSRASTSTSAPRAARAPSRRSRSTSCTASA